MLSSKQLNICKLLCHWTIHLRIFNYKPYPLKRTCISGISLSASYLICILKMNKSHTIQTKKKKKKMHLAFYFIYLVSISIGLFTIKDHLHGPWKNDCCFGNWKEGWVDPILLFSWNNFTMIWLRNAKGCSSRIAFIINLWYGYLLHSIETNYAQMEYFYLTIVIFCFFIFFISMVLHLWTPVLTFD